MKFRFFLFTLILMNFQSLDIKAQCDDKIGYDTQGSIASTKILEGFLSKIDTSLRVFFISSLVKTEMSNGISLYGYCDRATGTVDGTVKIKLVFQDQTSITLENYLKDENSTGFFAALITDRYRLLLLKTKPIIKIEITGSRLDATTYLVDGIVAINFLQGIKCLQQYL